MKKYRIYTAVKVDQIKGFPTVTESKMENLVAGSTTVMKYQRVDYDVGSPRDLFTERYLRNPPRSYLK